MSGSKRGRVHDDRDSPRLLYIREMRTLGWSSDASKSIGSELSSHDLYHTKIELTPIWNWHLLLAFASSHSPLIQVLSPYMWEYSLPTCVGFLLTCESTHFLHVQVLSSHVQVPLPTFTWVLSWVWVPLVGLPKKRTKWLFSCVIRLFSIPPLVQMSHLEPPWAQIRH